MSGQYFHLGRQALEPVPPTQAESLRLQILHYTASSPLCLKSILMHKLLYCYILVLYQKFIKHYHVPKIMFSAGKL